MKTENREMQMIERPAVPPTISTTVPHPGTANLFSEDSRDVLDDSDRRILIVDDEEPLRRLFAQYLCVSRQITE